MADDDTKTNDHISGLPIDPSLDATEAMGDMYGRDGVTTDYNESNASPVDIAPESVEQMSSYRKAANERKFSDRDVTIKVPEDTQDNPDPTASSDSVGNNTLDEATPPNVRGERSMSGSLPDPESDDDMLTASQEVGLRLDEDEEHPKELDIASDVDKAEDR